MKDKTLKDFYIGQPFFCQDLDRPGGFTEIKIHGTYVKDAISSPKGVRIIEGDNYQWEGGSGRHPNSIITSIEELIPYIERKLSKLSSKSLIECLDSQEMIAYVVYNHDRSIVNIRFATLAHEEESLLDGQYYIYQCWGGRTHEFKVKHAQLNDTRYINMLMHKDELGTYYATSFNHLCKGMTLICSPHFTKKGP